MEESYICCRVLVRDFADYYFTLSYLSDDETIRRDDFVIVPCGRNNTRKIGRVVRVKRCRGKKLPFPLERMKYVLSKTARPADWDESRKTPDFSSQRRAEKKKAEVSAGVKTEEKKQEPKPESCLPQQENAPAPKAAAEEPSKQTAEKTPERGGGYGRQSFCVWPQQRLLWRSGRTAKRWIPTERDFVRYPRGSTLPRSSVFPSWEVFGIPKRFPCTAITCSYMRRIRNMPVGRRRYPLLFCAMKPVGRAGSIRWRCAYGRIGEYRKNGKRPKQRRDASGKPRRRQRDARRS